MTVWLTSSLVLQPDAFFCEFDGLVGCRTTEYEGYVAKSTVAKEIEVAHYTVLLYKLVYTVLKLE